MMAPKLEDKARTGRDNQRMMIGPSFEKVFSALTARNTSLRRTSSTRPD